VTSCPGSHCVGTACQSSVVVAVHLLGREPVRCCRQSSLPRLTRPCRRSAQANSAFRPARYSTRALSVKTAVRPLNESASGRFSQTAGPNQSNQPRRRHLPTRPASSTAVGTPACRRSPYYYRRVQRTSTSPPIRPSLDCQPVADGHPPRSCLSSRPRSTQPVYHSGSASTSTIVCSHSVSTMPTESTSKRRPPSSPNVSSPPKVNSDPVRGAAQPEVATALWVSRHLLADRARVTPDVEQSRGCQFRYRTGCHQWCLLARRRTRRTGSVMHRKSGSSSTREGK